MKFNCKTKQYLEEMEAVLIESKHKVFQINFSKMEVYIAKQDTYRKRNGKICHVEHFGQWMPFAKTDIKYGKQNYAAYDSNVHGLEVTKGTKTVKYLDKETKNRMVAEYKNSTNQNERK